MKKKTEKIALVLIIIIIKILLWFLFKLEFVNATMFIYELLHIIPKGKHDFFIGMPIILKVVKASFLLVEVLVDFLLFSFLTFFHKNYIHKKFVFNSLFVSSFIVILFVIYSLI